MRPDVAHEPVPYAKEAPDVFLLDDLQDIYAGVMFPHKYHAAMTEISYGCSICHHHNEDQAFRPCKECHGGPSNPNDLKQPGLKGAYHRQCLACHRDWTHESDCKFCHVKRGVGEDVVLPEDPSDIIGMLHPNIEVPEVNVYEAKDMDDTPFVTFHHKDHTHLFGLTCADCHSEESCSRCHDTKVHKEHVRDDPHEDCDKCHQEKIDDDCTFCHKTEPATNGFDHAARTGFDVRIHHPEEKCDQCHLEKAIFTGLNMDCATCHAEDWYPDAFDHARLGVVIDETHVDLDCVDCHGNGIGRPKSCKDCHEEDMQTFPPPEGESEGEGEENDETNEESQ